MRAYDAKNIKYKDGLAEKRHRVWVLKTLFFVGLVIAAVGFILYLLFFSGFLEVKEISVNGLDKVSSDRFHNELNKRLNSKWLGMLEHQRNLIFFNSDIFKAEMLSIFPEIKDITLDKNLPHALNITLMEREAAGIWCFVGPPAGGCKYFDKEGNMWGEAAKSSGFLILVVDDLRPDVQLDKNLLEDFITIYERLKDMNIFVSKFTVPSNFVGDFKVLTSNNYELLFSMDSNIDGQLEVLDIFLTEKRGETSFKPQYIDIRIDGRIYYK